MTLTRSSCYEAEIVGVVYTPFLFSIYPSRVSTGTRQSDDELFKVICITGKYIYPARSQHSFGEEYKYLQPKRCEQ
jgi:hypothetical protein